MPPFYRLISLRSPKLEEIDQAIETAINEALTPGAVFWLNKVAKHTQTSMAIRRWSPKEYPPN